MPYKTAVNNETGEKTIFRSALSKDGNGERKWLPTNLTEIPAEDSPDAKHQARLDRAQAGKEYSDAAYEDELTARGPAAVARRAAAEKIPNIAFSGQDTPTGIGGQSAITLGREVDVMGSGVQDLGDFFEHATAKSSPFGLIGQMFTDKKDVLDHQRRIRDRSYDRKQKEARRDEMYKEFDEQAGFNKMSPALLYMLDSQLAGPATRKLFSSALSGVEKGVVNTAKYGGEKAAQGVHAIEASDGMLGEIGRKMQTEWVDPIKKLSARSKLRPDIERKFVGTPVNDIGGDIILGGIEGGLNRDLSVEDGMMASAAGSAGGQLLKPILGKAPSRLTSPEEKILQKGYDRGLRAYPGTATGLKKSKIFEAGQESSTRYADLHGETKAANMKVVNRDLGTAMGLPTELRNGFDPDILNVHKMKLKSQYDALEQASNGKMPMSVYNKMVGEVNALKGLKSAQAQDAYREGSAALGDLKGFVIPQRNAKGRFESASFSGKDFGEIRRRLKSTVKKAYNDGNAETGRTIQNIVDKLDAAMESGIGNQHGGATAMQWKDLNEQYAFTNMIQNNGMDSLGNIDMPKLEKYLMNTDAERTLQNVGGERLDLIQTHAKFDALERSGPGNANRTSGIEDVGKKTPFRAFIHTPAADRPSGLDMIYHDLYRRGWPSRTGLLGLSNKGFGDPSKYARALSQATQVHPQALGLMGDAYDTASDAVNWVMDTTGNTKDWIDENVNSKKKDISLMGE